MIGRTWSDLYEWLRRQSEESVWSVRLRDYLRVAESRLIREGYLTEGTLTMFDGFGFDRRNPYNYPDAKRLLKLALSELRHHPRLRRLGIDPKAPGRGAITGDGRGDVWDVLCLQRAER